MHLQDSSRVQPYSTRSHFQVPFVHLPRDGKDCDSSIAGKNHSISQRQVGLQVQKSVNDLSPIDVGEYLMRSVLKQEKY